jgi:hypothetical protein
LFSYYGGGAFCCAGNYSYDATCCDNSFNFGQNDVGGPFMPGFVSTSTSAPTITSTATSPSTITAIVTALSSGPSAMIVGVAVGVPLGLIATASCAAAAFLNRRSRMFKEKSAELEKMRTNYIQPKQDLEVDERRKQELHGNQLRHELH